MRIILCDSYEEISERAAELICAQITLKPDCVLGLATGSSPIGMYDRLASMKLDFSAVTTFNLDEYYPIRRENEQSYYYFMNNYLYSRVNLRPENIHIPSGECADVERECKEYEEKIQASGGIDLQVLGIGMNGHIGFNEPDDSLNTKTHLTDLTESTIAANSRFFESEDQVPKQAITMGISTILAAKKIILLASGKEKRHAISALMRDEINTEIPATMLKVHPDVVLICDREAYGAE